MLLRDFVPIEPAAACQDVSKPAREVAGADNDISACNFAQHALARRRCHGRILLEDVRETRVVQLGGMNGDVADDERLPGAATDRDADVPRSVTGRRAKYNTGGDFNVGGLDQDQRTGVVQRRELRRKRLAHELRVRQTLHR